MTQAATNSAANFGFDPGSIFSTPVLAPEVPANTDVMSGGGFFGGLLNTASQFGRGFLELELAKKQAKIAAQTQALQNQGTLTGTQTGDSLLQSSASILPMVVLGGAAIVAVLIFKD